MLTEGDKDRTEPELTERSAEREAVGLQAERRKAAGTGGRWRGEEDEKTQ